MNRYLAKFLTIFSLAAGAASIAGFYLALKLGYTGYALAIVFGVAILSSIYLLIIPDTALERNVASKVARFTLPSSSDEILIQRGEVSIGYGPTAVEFYEPFAERPMVEIVNHLGHIVGEPTVVATPHQAVFRLPSPGYPMPQVWRWIARGKPLKHRKFYWARADPR